MNPYRTRLDRGNAYWMAKLAKEAYRKMGDSDHRPDGQAILHALQAEDTGFIAVEGFDANSAQAIFVEHENYLCMAFRGTDEISDWLDNLNAFATKELFGEFHRGFWNATQDVWDGLWDACQQANAPNKRPLFLTGHSLGGAMATIAAARLVHQDRPFTSGYTFRQPRTMSRDTARIFNVECGARFHRFHNNNDLVTRIPARAMGYSHVGSYLYIAEDGTIHEDSGFWFRFVDCVTALMDDLGEKGLEGVKDHDIDEYLRAVERWELVDD